MKVSDYCTYIEDGETVLRAKLTSDVSVGSNSCLTSFILPQTSKFPLSENTPEFLNHPQTHHDMIDEDI